MTSGSCSISHEEFGALGTLGAECCALRVRLLQLLTSGREDDASDIALFSLVKGRAWCVGVMLYCEWSGVGVGVKIAH
jgi:hypothetical protein